MLKLIQNLKTFLILPPQRLLPNNHNMHVCPQTVESTETVFGFNFIHSQVSVGNKSPL